LLEASIFTTSAIQSAVETLSDKEQVIRAGQWLLHPEYWSCLHTELLDMLARKHLEFPIEIGVAQAEILDQLGTSKEIFDLLVAGLVEQEKISLHGGYVALSTHKPSLTREQETVIAEILKVFAERPGFPPTEKDLLEMVPDSEALIRYMCRRNLLVEMEDKVLFETSCYEKVKEEIIAIITDAGSISIQVARDRFGYTRKYVIPLFSKMDSEGITMMKDNERIFTPAFKESLQKKTTSGG